MEAASHLVAGVAVRRWAVVTLTIGQLDERMHARLRAFASRKTVRGPWEEQLWLRAVGPW
jgi:hypothetical protein